MTAEGNEMAHGSGNHWQVGDVALSRIVEFEVADLLPERLSVGLTAAEVLRTSWLRPDYANVDGTLRLSVHAFVIESQGVRLIVDTCVGNHKPRRNPHWNMLARPFLADLAAAGFPPDSVDFVLCTHLHVDHVGWNTRWDGMQWVPTFANARYLFGRLEWAHWAGAPRASGDLSPTAGQMLDEDMVLADSVLPIVRRGLHQLVETDHRITSEVSLVPTPGHTPGHVSVKISSRGETAFITGDMAHHPIQIADPTICSNFDHDRGLSTATRRQFLRDHADRPTLVLGTHFASPSGGYIVSEGGGWRFVAGKPGSGPRCSAPPIPPPHIC